MSDQDVVLGGDPQDDEGRPEQESAKVAQADDSMDDANGHWLERQDVKVVLSKITLGISAVGLEKALRDLPLLPADALTVTLIREELAERIKGAGLSVKVADAFIRSAPREDPVFDQVAGTVQDRDVESWPEPVEGDQLLDEIAGLYLLRRPTPQNGCSGALAMHRHVVCAATSGTRRHG